jgi:hypothetical protein
MNIFDFDTETRILSCMYLSILIAGFGGGLMRGLVGFLKHQYSYKTVKFNVPYFFTMMFLSGTIGLLTAVSVQEAGITILDITTVTPGLSFIIGYAGGDLIENVYKIIIKKPLLYS